MKVQIEKKGQFKLFLTNKGNEILVLNQDWFAIVQGNYGLILVRTNSDHEIIETLDEGEFYLADFNNDPNFKDMPHLFLKDGKKYKEFILPNDLPSKTNSKTKIVETK